MKKIILYLMVFCGALFTVKNAHADNGYFCVTENVVGLSYNENNKKWVSYIFKADTNYIIKRPPKDQKWSNENWIVVEVGSKDTSVPRSFCENDFNENGKLFCNGLALSNFKFNKNNNRFLATYLAGGFIDDIPGKGSPDFNLKEGEDAPMLIAGTCSSF